METQLSKRRMDLFKQIDEILGDRYDQPRTWKLIYDDYLEARLILNSEDPRLEEIVIKFRYNGNDFSWERYPLG
jgi:hypothetical protein